VKVMSKAKTRTFDGKKYQRAVTCKKKSTAKKRAKRLKKNVGKHLSVRTVKTKDGYEIYFRTF